MSKRLLSVFLAAALALGMTACGNNTGTTESNKETTVNASDWK